MRKSLDTAATNAFQAHAPSRLFAYVEAIAACGLLIFAAVTVLTPWY